MRLLRRLITVYSVGVAGIRANQTKSNQIKPNQTCEWEVPVAHGVALERNGVQRGFRIMNHLIKPGQTQSNLVKAGQSPSNPSNRSSPIKPDQTTKDQGLAGVRTNYGWPALRAARPSRNNKTASDPVKAGQTQSNQKMRFTIRQTYL